jgi:hypothetical protein
MRTGLMLVPTPAPVKGPLLGCSRTDGTTVEYIVWPERPTTVGRDTANSISLVAATDHIAQNGGLVRR